MLRCHVFGDAANVARAEVNHHVAVGEPLFVTKLDPVKRHVIVGPREALSIREIRLRDINWLGETGLNPLQFIPTSPVVDHKRIMLMEDLEDSLQAIPGGPPEIGPPSPEDG